MKQIALDDLCAAVASAVHRSQKALSEEHLKHVRSCFELNGEGRLKPRTLSMFLPREHVDEGQESVGLHNIPELTLTPLAPLALDSVTMRLDCSVKKLTCGEEPRVLVTLGSETKEGSGGEKSGCLELHFGARETPEGVARLNDQLLRGTC